MTGHELSAIGRHQNGYTPTAPKRVVYGSHARCECGQHFKSNSAPSKGGARSIKYQHEAHAAKLETLAHVLVEHRMGPTHADVANDPALSDIWDEIQLDPVAWHQHDHDMHRVPLNADHSQTEWGA